MTPRKVGIIGSGDVGQALANGFINYGNEVMLGYRHREKAVAEKNMPKKVFILSTDY